MASTQPIDVTPRKGTFHSAGDPAGESSIPRSRPQYGSVNTNVNENGCFESDRVIKSGYVERRTKTKNWKTVYLVMRPNTLSIYKNSKETKLRHQVHLSDLTAVTCLKDPKHKRNNVFGVFSPSRNFHFQAPTKEDAEEWVTLIRRDARIEEEEEEMFLASPLGRSVSPAGLRALATSGFGNLDRDRVMSSSPEAYGPSDSGVLSDTGRRKSSIFDSSGMSGNELPSQSDLSDNELQRPNKRLLMDSLAAQHSQGAGSLPIGIGSASHSAIPNQTGSQISVTNLTGNNSSTSPEQDPDRVIWQGWVWLLRSKRGVRQWKDMWGVLRPRNFILYKDESEYTAQWIVQLSVVVDVVDTDPVSKSKENCLQVITEEKSYRFCTHDEESLVQLIGAFKSLLAKRRGLEARVAVSSL